MTKIVKDFLGNRLEAGDWFVHSSRWGSTLRFKVGIIEEVFEDGSIRVHSAEHFSWSDCWVGATKKSRIQFPEKYVVRILPEYIDEDTYFDVQRALGIIPEEEV